MQKSIALVLSLVAAIIVVSAQPARAQETASGPQTVKPDKSPEPGKGELWELFRKGATAGDPLSKGLRLGVVSGCMDGFDIMLIAESRSYDEYKNRSAAMVRSDLTMDQILAKVDGFYAQPGNQDKSICHAVLTALHPPAQR